MLNISICRRKRVRIAKARRDERVPTLEQIRHAISTMPANTEIERRNRALIGFTILTGARDRATASIKLKHIDLDQGRIVQDARQVEYQVFQDIYDMVFPHRRRYPQDRRRLVQLFAAGEALGCRRSVVPGNKDRRRSLIAISRLAGLDRKHWSGAGPIRKIFKDAFEGAGLPYFNPHSFRKTLASIGRETLPYTGAVQGLESQNLGHEKVLTTFSSYGEVAAVRQRDIIRELGEPMEADPHIQQILHQLMRATRRTAA